MFAESFFLVACLSYSSTMKMETVYSSETLVNLYQTLRRPILEDGNIL
jgi:hypothetical protein